MNKRMKKNLVCDALSMALFRRKFSIGVIVTEAVGSGEMTIEEAEKFTAFLRHQRLLIQQAENTLKDEKWKQERGY